MDFQWKLIDFATTKSFTFLNAGVTVFNLVLLLFIEMLNKNYNNNNK